MAQRTSYKIKRNWGLSNSLEVSVKPFQRLVGAAAIGGRPSQRAKFPYPSKAPQKGECQGAPWQRGTAQVGGSPCYTYAFFYPLSAFFFGRKRHKEKSLAKKKCRKERFARCDERPRLRALDCGRFLRKATQKLSNKQFDKPQFNDYKIAKMPLCQFDTMALTFFT